MFGCAAATDKVAELPEIRCPRRYHSARALSVAFKFGKYIHALSAVLAFSVLPAVLVRDSKPHGWGDGQVKRDSGMPYCKWQTTIVNWWSIITSQVTASYSYTLQ